MNDKVTSKAQAGADKAEGRGVILQKERAQRQAQSLRDNLKKRKQQVRSRDDADKPDQ